MPLSLKCVIDAKSVDTKSRDSSMIPEREMRSASLGHISYEEDI